MSKFSTGITDAYSKLRSDLDAHIAAVHEQIKSEARIVFERVGAEFFAANPSALAIRWTQYTPYWSDGDACVFRPNSPDLQIFEVGKEDEDAEKYFEGQQNLLKYRANRLKTVEEIEAEIAGIVEIPAHSLRRPRGPVQLERARAEIVETDRRIAEAGGEEAYAKVVADFDAACDIIKSINKPDFEIVFGDHVQVFLTKDGVRVEEYDHD